MDSGIIVQLFLGILWALGCLLFVTFLLEFREDMFAHPNYPASARPTKPASKPAIRDTRSDTIAGQKSQDPSDGNSETWERPLCAKAGSHGR